MTARPIARPIALLGLRCSGKTSVGRVLAELLGRPFVDLDDETRAILDEMVESLPTVDDLEDQEGESPLIISELLEQTGDDGSQAPS